MKYSGTSLHTERESHWLLRTHNMPLMFQWIHILKRKTTIRWRKKWDIFKWFLLSPLISTGNDIYCIFRLTLSSNHVYAVFPFVLELIVQIITIVNSWIYQISALFSFIHSIERRNNCSPFQPTILSKVYRLHFQSFDRLLERQRALHCESAKII